MNILSSGTAKFIDCEFYDNLADWASGGAISTTGEGPLFASISCKPAEPPNTCAPRRPLNPPAPSPPRICSHQLVHPQQVSPQSPPE